MTVSKLFRGRLFRAAMMAVLLVGYAGMTGCTHKTVIEDDHHHPDYHDDHHDHW